MEEWCPDSTPEKPAIHIDPAAALLSGLVPFLTCFRHESALFLERERGLREVKTVANGDCGPTAASFGFACKNVSLPSIAFRAKASEGHRLLSNLALHDGGIASRWAARVVLGGMAMASGAIDPDTEPVREPAVVGEDNNGRLGKERVDELFEHHLLQLVTPGTWLSDLDFEAAAIVLGVRFNVFTQVSAAACLGGQKAPVSLHHFGADELRLTAGLPVLGPHALAIDIAFDGTSHFGALARPPLAPELASPSASPAPLPDRLAARSSAPSAQRYELRSTAAVAYKESSDEDGGSSDEDSELSGEDGEDVVSSSAESDGESSDGESSDDDAPSSEADTESASQRPSPIVSVRGRADLGAKPTARAVLAELARLEQAASADGGSLGAPSTDDELAGIDLDYWSMFLPGRVRMKRFFRKLGPITFLTLVPNSLIKLPSYCGQRMLTLCDGPYQIGIPASCQAAFVRALSASRTTQFGPSASQNGVYDGDKFNMVAMQLHDLLVEAGVHFIYLCVFGTKTPLKYFLVDGVYAPEYHAALPIEAELVLGQVLSEFDRMACTFEVALAIQVEMDYRSFNSDGTHDGTISLLSQDPYGFLSGIVTRAMTYAIFASAPFNVQAFTDAICAGRVSGEDGGAGRGCLGWVKSFISAAQDADDAGAACGHQFPLVSYSLVKRNALRVALINFFGVKEYARLDAHKRRVGSCLEAGERVYNSHESGGVRHEIKSGQMNAMRGSRYDLMLRLLRLAARGGIVKVHHFPASVMRGYTDAFMLRAVQAGLYSTVRAPNGKRVVSSDAIRLLFFVQNTFFNSTPKLVQRLLSTPLSLWHRLVGHVPPPSLAQQLRDLTDPVAMALEAEHRAADLQLGLLVEASAGLPPATRAAEEDGSVEGDRMEVIEPYDTGEGARFPPLLRRELFRSLGDMWCHVLTSSRTLKSGGVVATRWWVNYRSDYRDARLRGKVACWSVNPRKGNPRAKLLKHIFRLLAREALARRLPPTHAMAWRELLQAEDDPSSGPSVRCLRQPTRAPAAASAGAVVDEDDGDDAAMGVHRYGGIE